MDIDVLVFIQRRPNGRYLLTVPAQPDVSVIGPTLTECKEEATLALIQRLEDMEPDEVEALAARSGHALTRRSFEVRPKRGDGRRRREPYTLAVSLVLTPGDDRIMVQAPRLREPDTRRPLTFFVRNRDELDAVAQAEVAEYFADVPLEALPDYQAARHEDIDTLGVSFKPKSPVRSAAEKVEASASHFWALRASGINLTAQAKEGQLGRAYRREAIVEQVLSILAAAQRPSLILTGPAGAGKTAIVHEVARRIQRKECPEALHDRQLWGVTGASLLAGMAFIGQWQEKLTDLVRDVRKHRHILFVEDVAGLADAGRWSKSDENMAQFLKPYIQSGDVVILGESTPERLRYSDRLTPGFVSQFRSVAVDPPGVDDTLSILTSVSHRIEKAETVRLQPAALHAAVELTTRFMPYRAQPGKAIRLLEQAAADAAQARTGTGDARRALDRRHVVASFTRQTGLPESMLTDARPLDLDAVRRHFAERVIGQPDAVDTMTDLVAVVKAGLHDPHKPLGVFLFIGPTGVGKTEMAKTLAAYLFGDAARLVRFDMSEYMDPAGLRRLIGVPGSDAEGELTGKVRAQPFCVVLLDEIEKADVQVFDLFLQVLGEGRLTDATGQTTSFQNAIILLTSNLGAGAREQRALGLAADGRPAGAMDDAGYWRGKIEQFFRPEFVNRIDRIVVFQPLGPEVMRQIARREVDAVLAREGLARRGILVEVDDPVLDLLVDEGFTANYGARPLKRAIERLVVVPLARWLAQRTDEGGLVRLRREGNAVALAARAPGDDEATATVELGGATAGRATTRRMSDKALVEGFAALRIRLHAWREHEDVVELAGDRALALDVINTALWKTAAGDRVGAYRTFNRLDRLLKRLDQLADRAEYLEELAGLVHRQRDARYRKDLAASYARLARDVDFLEVELLTAGEDDADRAVVLLRPVGARLADGDAAVPVTRLAGMYGRWALRKGYAVDVATLAPLEITPEALATARKRALDHVAAHRARVMTRDAAQGLYPYVWNPLAAGDGEGLVKELATLPAVREIAIVAEGANVFGFLKGEQGIHRFEDRRAGGGKAQALVEVRVKRPWHDDPLLCELYVRGLRSREAVEVVGAMPAPEPDAEGAGDPEQVARVYDLAGTRAARDPRTKVRHADVKAVLDGDIDDFVLGWLRWEREAGDGDGGEDEDV